MSTTTRPVRRHFHVPAQEMLLEQAERCLFLPGLTLDGLAVTARGDHHLILTLADTDRIYLGPDDTTVSQRAQILADALHHGRAAIAPDHAALIRDWIQLAWEAMLDEVVDAISGPALKHL